MKEALKKFMLWGVLPSLVAALIVGFSEFYFSKKENEARLTLERALNARIAELERDLQDVRRFTSQTEKDSDTKKPDKNAMEVSYSYLVSLIDDDPIVKLYLAKYSSAESIKYLYRSGMSGFRTRADYEESTDVQQRAEIIQAVVQSCNSLKFRDIPYSKEFRVLPNYYAEKTMRLIAYHQEQCPDLITAFQNRDSFFYKFSSLFDGQVPISEYTYLMKFSRFVDEAQTFVSGFSSDLSSLRRVSE